jgi:hypothetical protein
MTLTLFDLLLKADFIFLISKVGKTGTWYASTTFQIIILHITLRLGKIWRVILKKRRVV